MHDMVKSKTETLGKLKHRMDSLTQVCTAALAQLFSDSHAHGVQNTLTLTRDTQLQIAVTAASQPSSLAFLTKSLSEASVHLWDGAFM